MAEAPAGDGPGEDRWLFHQTRDGTAWAAVIDGASSSATQGPTGGDYADALRAGLLAAVQSDPRREPSDALARGIKTAIKTLGLPQPSAPSAAVGIARWTEEGIQVACLGDVAVALVFPVSERVLQDSRLGQVDQEDRSRYKRALQAGAGYGTAHEETLARLRQAERACRNVDGGYWIAADDPAAASKALTLTDSRELDMVVLASDGAAAAITRYEVCRNWRTLAEMVMHNQQAFIDRVRSAESHDPDGRRWPRSKPSDDLAVLVVERSSSSNNTRPGR